MFDFSGGDRAEIDLDFMKAYNLITKKLDHQTKKDYLLDEEIERDFQNR